MLQSQQEQSFMADRALLPAWQRRAMGAGFLVVIGSLIAYRKEIEAVLIPILESVNALGPWAPVVLALLYIPACMCLVPSTFLNPGIGFLLGPVWGFLTAAVGMVLGHTATFIVSRRLGRSWFFRNATVNPRYRAVELACQREGFKIVMLTRLSPVFPSNIMSYFFGVTSVSVRAFAAGTAIGMFPRTIIATSIGAAAKSFMDASHSGGDSEIDWLMVAGLTAVTIVVLILITRIARRALNDAIEKEQAHDADVAPTASSITDEAA
jgi:uncharacterized membrane protein YdjX (TVP38/TMEM64 family)